MADVAIPDIAIQNVTVLINRGKTVQCREDVLRLGFKHRLGDLPLR
jgi:hypothetical protein